MILQALARDGHRCVLTRLWDVPSIRADPEVKRLYKANGTVKGCHTQCTRIFEREAIHKPDGVEEVCWSIWVLRAFAY